MNSRSSLSTWTAFGAYAHSARCRRRSDVALPVKPRHDMVQFHGGFPTLPVTELLALADQQRRETVRGKQLGRDVLRGCEGDKNPRLAVCSTIASFWEAYGKG